jgi:GntR family transcriptional regulator
MNIVISNTSNLAIYEQIVAQIKNAIINKEILADEPLPSIRSLARDLQISVITTSRAYDELVAEGLVYSLPGKGYYVSKSQTEMLKEKRLQVIEANMTELINQCKAAGLNKDDITAMINILYDN